MAKQASITYRHVETQSGGYITAAGTMANEIGKVAYNLENDGKLMNITWVNVFQPYEGNGIGTQLVQQAVKQARRKGWKIFPQCVFARYILDKVADKVSDVYQPKTETKA